jgi:opacity protein-like surface antigen
VRRVLVLLLALGALAPAPADAGTYHVYACTTAGKNWGNASWSGPAVAGFVVDTNCAQRGSLIGLRGSARFKVAYRFRDGRSRGREFRFRAKLRAGKRYPFVTGYSRRVTVRVR